MARVILYYAHPGQRFSQANRALYAAAQSVAGIERVDLCAEYPRFDIDVEREQARLLANDVVVMQFPLFWYSSPAIVKEWQDLVLEHGFAYGAGGTALRGKTLLLALTAAGSEHAYSEEGYQKLPMRQFLTPFERTAGLCGMSFPAPYVLYGALRAPDDGRLDAHVAGYRRLLAALREDRYDRADAPGTVGAESLALTAEAAR